MLPRKHRDVPGFLASLHLHFSVRLHAALLLVSATVAGLVVSRLLLWLGLETPILRFPVAVTSAYLLFLAFVNAWLWWIGVKRSPTRDAGSYDEHGWGGGGGTVAPIRMDHGNRGLKAIEDVLSGLSNIYFGELTFAMLLLAVVFGALWACGWVIAATPELLIETAVDVAVASGLIRSISRSRAEFWFDELFAKTFGKALVLAFFAFCLGVAVRVIDPKAFTLGQAVRHLIHH